MPPSEACEQLLLAPHRVFLSLGGVLRSVPVHPSSPEFRHPKPPSPAPRLEPGLARNGLVFLLPRHPAPSHIAGITWRAVTEESHSYRRVETVRPDQEAPCSSRPSAKRATTPSSLCWKLLNAQLNLTASSWRASSRVSWRSARCKTTVTSPNLSSIMVAGIP